ncbi:S-Ena type endospore appendage [Longirhabdus pacifica]|uniref:S-Ena type endospore appendage n=1 Tax=Longirhabdus pacifica TaxID=2305227 RepID=UPI0010088DD3|nr:S-Ena type endospore appendage [Longirhabdus pacifica]
MSIRDRRAVVPGKSIHLLTSEDSFQEFNLNNIVGKREIYRSDVPRIVSASIQIYTDGGSIRTTITRKNNSVEVVDVDQTVERGFTFSNVVKIEIERIAGTGSGEFEIYGVAEKL